jgi:thiol-disulfide isomerase/thioredoxin
MIRTTLLAVAATLLFTTMACANPPGQTGGVHTVESVTKTTKGKAVDFTWKDGSETKSFSDYTNGKVVLLNVWATWCGPCKREIPDLVELNNEMASKGVVVFGVSVDQHQKKVQMVTNYVEKVGISYINVIDQSPPKIAEAYGGIQAIPTTFIIDRDGNIVQKLVGMKSKAEFKAALERAMK